jgi:hypothetical protein
MAAKGISWVPTFSPVHFQFEHSELGGWSGETIAGLWRILEQHFEMISLAGELSVPIVAGSDAGSCGVPHGPGLVDELFFLRRAGLPLESVLESGTSRPRRLWNCASADVRTGNRANLIALDGSPFDELESLRRVRWLLRGSDCLPVESREATGQSDPARGDGGTAIPLGACATSR